jgi:hypothetical protein
MNGSATKGMSGSAFHIHSYTKGKVKARAQQIIASGCHGYPSYQELSRVNCKPICVSPSPCYSEFLSWCGSLIVKTRFFEALYEVLVLITFVVVMLKVE